MQNSQSEVAVLIVDDSLSIRQTVKNALTSLGYINVHMASNGATALEECRKNPFKIVFLDLHMPEMDGLTFLKKYRNELGVKDSAVIVLTASFNKEDILTAMENGATAYVTKPVSNEHIEKEMNKALKWLSVKDGKSTEKVFSSSLSDQLKDLISKSLAETFKVLFSVDISAVDPGEDLIKKDDIRSYVEIRIDSVLSYMIVAIPSRVASQLVDALGTYEGAQRDVVAQDVTCEVANIVGHAVQNQLEIMHKGKKVEMDIPQPGVPNVQKSEYKILSVRSMSKDAETVHLDLVYSESE